MLGRTHRRQIVNAIAAFGAILRFVAFWQSAFEELADAPGQSRGGGRGRGGGGSVQKSIELIAAGQRFRQRGSASFLQRRRQSARLEQRHFRFGGRRRDHREKIVDDALEAREGDAETSAILEVAQSAGESVEETTDRRRFVLLERSSVMTPLTVVPQQTCEIEKKKEENTELWRKNKKNRYL